MNANRTIDHNRPVPRFLTIEDGIKFYHGSYRSAHYPGDKEYDDCMFEFGVVMIGERYGWPIPDGPAAIGAFHSPSQVERIDNLE